MFPLCEVLGGPLALFSPGFLTPLALLPSAPLGGVVPSVALCLSECLEPGLWGL